MSDTQKIGEVAVWNVKDFSVEIRKHITDAARRQNCTVADWLHAYFHKHGLEGVEISRVEITAANPADWQLPLGILDTEHAPRWLRAGAARRLGAMIGAVPPTPPARPKRLASPEAATGQLDLS